MYSREFQTIKWDEFKAMLVGIGPETALGRVVGIRAENDEEVLKSYTKEMHQIRNEWRRKVALERSPQETEAFVESMKRALINMAK